MAASIYQTSFTSGELSPEMYGRVDFNRYYSGLKTCRNFIIKPTGGVVNRPGTKYVAAVHNSSYAVRLIPFQSSVNSSYVLEFGHLTMRIILNGAVVTSGGNPVVVTTIYPASQLHRLTFTQSFDVMTICHPDYPVQQLSRLSDTSWSFAAFDNLEGPFQDINIIESQTVSTSNVTGTITITSNADIFASTMVGQMFYIEQSSGYSLDKWEVDKTVAIGDKIRAGSHFYVATTAGKTGTVRPDHTEGTANDGNPGIKWEYLHSGFGIALISGYTNPRVVTATVLKRLPDSVSGTTEGKDISGAVDDGTGLVVNVTCYAHGFSTGDSVTIVGVVGMTDINGTHTITKLTDHSFSVPVTTEQTYTSGGTASIGSAYVATYKWAVEAWGGSSGYPGAVCYSQQRQVFANSNAEPQSIWFSTISGFKNFGVSVPSLATDAMDITIANRGYSEIRHFVELGELLVMASDGTWIVRGGQDNTLTADTINVKRQTYDGISNLPPVTVGSGALFVRSAGDSVGTVQYNLTQDSYVNNDLSIAARHLFENKSIVDWTYQRNPFSTVWAVRSDGVLLGLTYIPEHEVSGWHWHDTSGGLFENVCSVNESGVDAVYCVVNRGSTRYIERFNTRVFATVNDAFFVDAGYTYSGASTSSITGLTWLEGKTVAILADGFVHKQKVVTGGAVALDYPATKVHVGLPIVADLETLSITASGQPSRERVKLIQHLSVLVNESIGIKAGPDTSHLSEYKQRKAENYDAPADLKSGLLDIRIAATWSKDGHVVVRQDSPLPVSILAIIPEVSTGGS